MGIVKTSLPRRGDFSLCKKYLPFFVTPNEARGASLSLGRTKNGRLAGQKMGARRDKVGDLFEQPFALLLTV